MTDMRLHRAPHRALPLLPIRSEMALALGRVHELCGPARRTLAAMVAMRTSGPVLWIAPGWDHDRLNPDGLCAFFDPGRVIFAHPTRPEDLLWCAEQSLRSGAAPLVVADLPGPPALTPVRRLHLSAEAGAEVAPQPPLGLLLTPGDGGAPGVESRWHMAQDHGRGCRAWTLARRRARTQPQAAWRIADRSGKGTPVAASEATPIPV